MVADVLMYLSSFVLISCLTLLAIFIFKLQLNVRTETGLLLHRDRKTKMSMTEVKLPFSIDVETSSSSSSSVSTATTTEEDEFTVTLKGSSSGLITYYCCVAIKELEKAINPVQRAESAKNKTLVNILDLLSLWNSKPRKFCFQDGNYLHHNCPSIPSEIKEKLNKVVSNLSSDLLPYVVHMQLTNEERQNAVSNSNIVALMTAFKSSNREKFEIAAQYIEMADQRIYPIKKLFNSGVAESSSLPTNGSIESNELCIVCHHYPVTRVIIPCRHSCVCKLCFKKLDVCPICRKQIDSFFVISDESAFPMSEEEVQDQTSNDINNMGLWNFIKSVWNAS